MADWLLIRLPRTPEQPATWITVDDTGARHKAANGFCTQIGNAHFTWFGSTGSKSRINFLELMRAGHSDYVISDEALAYMRQRALSGPVVARLAEHPNRFFPDQAAWNVHLDQLGISALKVNPDPVTIATEGAKSLNSVGKSIVPRRIARTWTVFTS